MRTWSTTSAEVYDTLDPRLQKILTRVRDEVADISLIQGYRDKRKQDKYFAKGFTKVEWPNSKHNTYPSLAVDFNPWPSPTTEPKLWGALGYIAGRAIAIAAEEGVTLRWGGDWNRNGDLTDQNFDDLFHLEII